MLMAVFLVMAMMAVSPNDDSVSSVSVIGVFSVTTVFQLMAWPAVFALLRNVANP